MILRTTLGCPVDGGHLRSSVSVVQLTRAIVNHTDSALLQRGLLQSASAGLEEISISTEASFI